MWHFCGVHFEYQTHTSIITKNKHQPKYDVVFLEWIAYEFYATSIFPQWNYSMPIAITLPLQSGYSANTADEHIFTHIQNSMLERSTEFWSVHFLLYNNRILRRKKRQRRNAQTDTCFEHTKKTLKHSLEILIFRFRFGLVWFCFY